MSYPQSLDEYEDQQLLDELQRRRIARSKGVCDYCARPFQARPKCDSGRHVPPTDFSKDLVK